MITAQQIQEIWKENSAYRSTCAKAKSYYFGYQSISELSIPRRSDGLNKTKVLTNYCQYIANSHTSFALANDLKYHLKDTTNVAALDYFKTVRDKNNIDQLDEINYLNCILYGQSVEVHSFDGINQIIKVTNPYDWSFVKNELGDIVLGIYMVKLPKNTFYEGKITTEDIFLYYIYDDTTITIYKNQSDYWGMVSQEFHNFGRIPIVIYNINNYGTPLFGDPFYTAIDNADITVSSLIDNIKYDVDALLKTKNIEIDQLLHKDADGVSILAKLKAVGLFPIPKDAEAEYLEKSVDVQKYDTALKNILNSIYLMGGAPNIIELINNGLGNLSNVALKIIYSLALNYANSMSKFFEKGLRDRINLINIISGYFNKPLLVDYEIIWTFNLPSNSLEILQYLPNLEGKIAIKDQIKLLKFVDNPEEAYQNLEEEELENKNNIRGNPQNIIEADNQMDNLDNNENYDE